MRKTEIFEAYLDDFKIIHIYRKKDTFQKDKVFFYMEDSDTNQEQLQIMNIKEEEEYVCFECSLASDIVFAKAYVIVNEVARQTPLRFAGIVKQEMFDTMFAYDGNDLGACYTQVYTDFKVWAPTAYDMKLELYDDHQMVCYAMKRMDKGVYHVRVSGDVKYIKYLYVVSVNGEIYRSLDPYTKAVDLNTRHSVVVDIAKPVRSTHNLPKMTSYCDAILYEASIRDFSEGHTFMSFIDETNKNQGFSYMLDLGITHVQLLPTFDFSGVNEVAPMQSYNWGYDVNMWFALENSYSSNPHDAKQGITDLQKLVTTCHDNGIRVNLDVVYNHVFDTKISGLDMLVPYYYFQLTEDYKYSNATMCGNDVDSKRYMTSKLIFDSCMYLLEYFDIDGLRFDLMGILDIDTLNRIVSATQKIKPEFMVYGEGWNMPSTLVEPERAAILNNAKMPKVAHFSDVFRDIIKGKQINHYLEYGYALGNTSLLFPAMNVLSASVGDFGNHKVFSRVENVVNYVECHDNMTSWDQINSAMPEAEADKIKRQQMMLAFVLLSQGIPFIQSGQEFLRSKQGFNDTYNMSDSINRLDYTRKDQYLSVVSYVKDLIAIRKQHAVFRKYEVEDVYYNIYYEHLYGKVLCYILSDSNEKIQVIFNPTQETFHQDFEEEWTLFFRNGMISELRTSHFDILPLDVIILKR